LGVLEPTGQTPNRAPFYVSIPVRVLGVLEPHYGNSDGIML